MKNQYKINSRLIITLTFFLNGKPWILTNGSATIYAKDPTNNIHGKFRGEIKNDNKVTWITEKTLLKDVGSWYYSFHVVDEGGRRFKTNPLLLEVVI